MLLFHGIYNRFFSKRFTRQAYGHLFQHNIVVAASCSEPWSWCGLGLILLLQLCSNLWVDSVWVASSPRRELGAQPMSLREKEKKEGYRTKNRGAKSLHCCSYVGHGVGVGCLLAKELRTKPGAKPMDIQERSMATA